MKYQTRGEEKVIRNHTTLCNTDADKIRYLKAHKFVLQWFFFHYYLIANFDDQWSYKFFVILCILSQCKRLKNHSFCPPFRSCKESYGGKLFQLDLEWSLFQFISKGVTQIDFHSQKSGTDTTRTREWNFHSLMLGYTKWEYWSLTQ